MKLKLTAEELGTFSEISAHDVSRSRLRREAETLDLVADYPALVKEIQTGDAADKDVALCRAILDRFNERELACDLADRLFWEIGWSPGNKEKMAAFTRSVRDPRASLPARKIPAKGGKPARHSVKPLRDRRQALLKSRDHYMTTPRLQEFTNEVCPRVGILVGTFPYQGELVSITSTAFLVGPDLAMTAYHVFDEFFEEHQEKEAPAHFKVVFDHSLGEPIESIDDLRRLPHARIVDLDGPHWLGPRSESFPEVGTTLAPSAQECKDLQIKLDFALIKLREPVGNLPVKGGSRQRRGWIKVQLPTIQFPYAEQRSVAMPQHPGGMALRHSFGVISGDWDKPPPPTTSTRVIYQLETAGGSSGAPCLNNEMELIGIHTAAYHPKTKPKPLGNLAVRIDAIYPQLTAYLASLAVKPQPKSIWRVTRPDRLLSPVLGRDVLQAWLDKAVGGASSDRSRSDRVYVANAPKLGAGKSFTVEILRTFLPPGHIDKVIVFDKETELVPDKLEDFVAALAEAFEMRSADLGPVPPRPGPGLPREAKDGDKLDRWESQEVPEWFAERLELCRKEEINRTEIAKAQLALDKKSRRESRLEDVELAGRSPPEIDLLERWRKAWVVFDDVAPQSLSPQVRKFIAGLIGADVNESAITDVRADINWLFLGASPEFLIPSDMATETLSPDSVADAAIAATLRAAFEEADIAGKPENLVAGIVDKAPGVLLREHAAGNTGQTLLSVSQELTAQSIETIYAAGGFAL